MNKKELKKAIRNIVKRAADVESNKASRRYIAGEIMVLIEDEVYFLDELKEDFDYMLENGIDRGERARYSDCFDMFLKYLKTGKTHPTLEELAE